MRAFVGVLLVTMVLMSACGAGDDGASPADAAAIDAAAVDAVPLDGAPADAEPLPEVTAPMLALGFSFSCLLHPTGRVKCWGDNSSGQLGLGDTAARGDAPGELGGALPWIDLGTGRHAIAIAGGLNHVCAILDDHRLKCWGSNGHGELGLGDTAARGDQPGEMGDALPAVDLGAGRTALAVAAGEFSTCALLDDHSVKCWGANDQGQLGQGDTVQRGDDPGELGDALAPVDVGSLHVADLGVGYYFACVTSDEGDVRCWGSNSEGQLGQGTTQRRGDDPGEMGAALVATTFGAGRFVARLGVGRFHSCAILDGDGALKCFGAGTSGQLGQGDLQSRGDQPGEMGDALPVVDLGVGRTARGLAFTQSDVCALLDDDEVKCWGNDFYGQAGQGHRSRIGDGPGEMGDALQPVPLPVGRAVRQVAGGGEHMCALFEDGGVRCWGFNDRGQLGQGDTETRGDDPGEVAATADVALY
ncbi:MAG: hypothetical protein H6709_07200 [Kofleriaceae bacterium]|nr:hypothetical protein [Myxococcales bacterium]MCB9560082.1 hypothetical protein [Kofleriaceae bacterium]MCB9571865.1 hypothetical protein [Kofleriaceae bacterium]